MQRNIYAIMALFAIAMLVSPTIAASAVSASPAISNLYPSKITIAQKWLGCNSNSYGENIVITIPVPPTSVTYLSWRISPTSSDGIKGIYCATVPFQGMSGQMLDLTQGWIEVLIPAPTTPSGSLQLNLSQHPLHLGDTIVFGFQISYGITNVNVGYTCYHLGYGYSNCANLAQ